MSKHIKSEDSASNIQTATSNGRPATAGDVLRGRDPKDAAGNMSRLKDAGWSEAEARQEALIYQDEASIDPAAGEAARGRVEALGRKVREKQSSSNGKAKLLTPRKLTAIKFKPIRWVWAGRFPLGEYSVVFGPEGLGKGLTLAHVAAQATLGRLDGEFSGQPVGVEFLAYEDDAESVLGPRLIAAGADPELVQIHSAGEGDVRSLVLPDDVPELEDGLRERGSKLLVIDPITEALHGRLSADKEQHVRQGIGPLHRMAQRLGIAVVAVMHPNKSAEVSDNKLVGARAWRALPRSVLFLGDDPDAPDGETRRVLALSKANFTAKARVPSLVYRHELTEVAGIGSVPHAVPAGTCDYSDQDLLAFQYGAKRMAASEEKLNSKGEQAKRLITSLFDDAPDNSITAKLAYAAAEEREISKRTMRRACEELGVESHGTKDAARWTRVGLKI